VPTPDYRLTQLETLEAESIHIIREVAAELERPVMPWSRFAPRLLHGSAAPSVPNHRHCNVHNRLTWSSMRPVGQL